MSCSYLSQGHKRGMKVRMDKRGNNMYNIRNRNCWNYCILCFNLRASKPTCTFRSLCRVNEVTPTHMTNPLAGKANHESNTWHGSTTETICCTTLADIVNNNMCSMLCCDSLQYGIVELYSLMLICFLLHVDCLFQALEAFVEELFGKR